METYGDPYMGMGPGMIFPFLVFIVLAGIPLWRILTRAGFSGAWVLLLILPPIGWLVITLMLAFAQWPVWARRAEE